MAWEPNEGGRSEMSLGDLGDLANLDVASLQE
jgi:hypothetical protein